MQYRDEETKNRAYVNEQAQQAEYQSEMRNPWYSSLGVQRTGIERQAKSEPEVMIQPLANDPWSDLLHAQGVQIIDLQQIRLHAAMEAPLDDVDVEQVLYIMQEEPIKGRKEG